MKIQEYIIKKLKKKGADDIVAVKGSYTTSHIKFNNNKVSTTQFTSGENISIFMSWQKRIALTSLKQSSIKAADIAVNQLLKTAKTITANEDYNGIAEGPFKYKDIKNTYDPRLTKADDRMPDYIEEAINLAIANGAERCAGELEIVESNVRLLTSNNVEADDRGTAAYFSIRALCGKDASGHFVNASRTLSGFDWKTPAMNAGRIAASAKNPRNGISGKLDVIFEPLSFANLIQSVGEASSIHAVEAGLSFLSGKIGRRVGRLSLFDDGRIEHGLRSAKFDEEGVPKKRTAIIENGILKTYLHNTSTAKKYKVKTTANAGLIGPEPSNLVVEKGGYSRDELFKEIKRGLYITNTWYTRFNNYNTGDFSTIPRDGIFYVEDGEVKYPVKGIRISDNMLRILGNIDAVGNETTQIHGWEVHVPIFTPAVVVRKVNITKPVALETGSSRL